MKREELKIPTIQELDQMLLSIKPIAVIKYLISLTNIRGSFIESDVVSKVMYCLQINQIIYSFIEHRLMKDLDDNLKEVIWKISEDNARSDDFVQIYKNVKKEVKKLNCK